MSDHQAILAWMARIDAKVDAIQASLLECQGRHSVDRAIKRMSGTNRARLVKGLIYLVTAAAGALAALAAGN